MLVTFRGAARAAAAHHRRRIAFTRQLLGHGHGHDCTAIRDGLALLSQSSSRIASHPWSSQLYLVNKPSPPRNIRARDSVELPLLSTLVPPHAAFLLPAPDFARDTNTRLSQTQSPSRPLSHLSDTILPTTVKSTPDTPPHNVNRCSRR